MTKHVNSRKPHPDKRFNSLSSTALDLFNELFGHLSDTYNQVENGFIAPTTGLLVSCDVVSYYWDLVRLAQRNKKKEAESVKEDPHV